MIRCLDDVGYQLSRDSRPKLKILPFVGRGRKEERKEITKQKEKRKRDAIRENILDVI